jgi:glycine/serine hydroxymethyltransferase
MRGSGAIADSIGALVMCDMAHPAGLIAKGQCTELSL